MARAVFAIVVTVAIPCPVMAGAFSGSHGLFPVCLSPDCPPDPDCPCDPFIVVHPTGYTSAGIGGEIEIKVCVDPATSSNVMPAVVEALPVLNALVPTTGNCENCLTSEETGASGAPFSMASAVLHELGHCALGLGHSNYRQDVMTPPNNFTAATTVATYDDGADDVRGSRDDIATPPPPSPPNQTRVIHWFRKTDNDPVAIDGTVIDSSTYSRAKTDLPTGSTWPANANRFVSDLLGAGDDTQSLMHAVAAAEMRWTGLTADDVNTVRYGMTGLDSIAGTADDYTINLTLSDCPSADIEVLFEPIDSAGTIAVCLMQLDPIDPVMPAVGYIHHVPVPIAAGGLTKLRVVVDSDGSTLWDIIFADGFETGDLSNWSTP